jgi:hypothetical protein
MDRALLVCCLRGFGDKKEEIFKRRDDFFALFDPINGRLYSFGSKQLFVTIGAEDGQ